MVVTRSGEDETYTLIPLFSFMILTTAQKEVCPPWFVPDNRTSTGCSCHHKERTEVNCNSTSTSLNFGYCMTYNSSYGLNELGKCPFIAHYITDNTHRIPLPDNVSELNEYMCGPLNREGTLCGKCKDGYGIALYSYTLECAKCWRHGYGWVLYFLLELVPITVLYFLVVIFHIRATSSPLSALVLLSQVMVYTIRLNIPLHMYIENEVTGFPYVMLQVLLVLCSIWSLDFFRSVIPPFCVSSSIKTVHALALEYLVAFYPICLILITYLCIKLQYNNFRPIVWLWKPFHRHCVNFRRWDTKTSMVNVFTTFLLLFFSKILFLSFTLLYTTYVHYNSHTKTKRILYYDPTVEFHTQEYAIFGSIAGCVLAIFVILPTILLILYPLRVFTKFLSSCGFQRWNALHMFVESFQGQYKDGTNGTRDFRMVSASFLLLRILILSTYTLEHYDRVPIMLLQCGLLMAVSCFHAVARPYKTSYSNIVDIVILAMLECFLSLTFVLVVYHSEKGGATIEIFAIGLSLLLGVPHMALVIYIINKLAEKTGITHCLKFKYIGLKEWILLTRQINQAKPNVEATFDIESLPDRLINPGEYEPLIPNTNEHTVGESTDSKVSITEEPRQLTPVYTYESIN